MTCLDSFHVNLFLWNFSFLTVLLKFLVLIWDFLPEQDLPIIASYCFFYALLFHSAWFYERILIASTRNLQTPCGPLFVYFSDVSQRYLMVDVFYKMTEIEKDDVWKAKKLLLLFCLIDVCFVDWFLNPNQPTNQTKLTPTSFLRGSDGFWWSFFFFFWKKKTWVHFLYTSQLPTASPTTMFSKLGFVSAAWAHVSVFTSFFCWFFNLVNFTH